MEDYIENMLEDVPGNMDGHAMTPAGAHLFKVNAGAEHLDKNTSEVFHSISAKILFLCKRGPPDVQVPIAFCAQGCRAPRLMTTRNYTKWYII